MTSYQREHWGSRIGLVLAMAGNAIGLGNFLRFPRLAAQYGGGAFLIPYLTALLLLGIPLMLMEWSMGRFGGMFGHSTTPGAFERMWRNRWAKYLGSLGVSLPLLFLIFYTCIESWTLAYSWFTLRGTYFPASPAQASQEIPKAIPGITAAELRTVLAAAGIEQDLPQAKWPTDKDPGVFALLDQDQNGLLSRNELDVVLNPLKNAHTRKFLAEYQGTSEDPCPEFFDSIWPSIGFWVFTVALNTWVLSRGLSGGIERLAKFAMPLLFLFAVILVVLVFLHGTPDPDKPDHSVWAGFNYIWEPNFRALADFNVWLSAAGQIFFTLSIGSGAIQCYASYLNKDEDCALTGMTTAATNEFAEIILGSSVAIPIAVATFGLANTRVIAEQGSFDLGFVAMPIIFEQMGGWGRLFGTLWFLLLFFAGITSSVALAQPLVALLEDEFGCSRRVAAFICGMVMLTFGLPVMLWLGKGYLDQYDFWIGTFGLTVFALIETVLFAWVYGGENMWREITRGAAIPIPRLIYPVIRYVVPAYLLVLLVGWVVQEFATSILLKNALPENVPYLWFARGTILLIVLGCAGLVAVAWRRGTANRAEAELAQHSPEGASA